MPSYLSTRRIQSAMPLYVPSEETARRVLTSSMGYMIA